MPVPPSVDTEYISIPSSRPDDNFQPKTNVLIRTHKEVLRKSPPSRLKFSFIIRTSIFVIFELGFIILTSLAMANPIPIGRSPHMTLTIAKGALTVISITWHALAIFIVKDVILHIFSAEWAEQYRRSGSIILGETDSVSRITAGLFRQIRHFTSRKATFPFRLGFVAILLLMLLNGLGPSAITINSIPTSQIQKIKVANLTMTRNLSDKSSDPGLLAVDRADLIIRLEHFENAVYGFRASEANVLIPWPSSDLISANGTIRYQSDVIKYDFSCSWKQPTNNRSTSDLVIDKEIWSAFIPAMVTAGFRAAFIYPMWKPHTLPGKANSPLTAFLFTEDTLSKHVTLNLGEIPTSVFPPSSSICGGPCLATSLVCDPQLRISPATVTLFGGSLSAVMHSGPPVVKNIPVEAANAIFSQSLLRATSSAPSLTDQFAVNDIAGSLFFTNSSLLYNKTPASGIKPLPLDMINQQMNTVLLSSSKAFLSGYQPNADNPGFPLFMLVDTDAVVEIQQLALAGSRPFLIALVVVVGVLVMLLITLVVVARFDWLQTFDLENIIKTLRID